MEIAKELIFFLTGNGRDSPDIGKRHFNKTVARKFSIPQPPAPPQGSGMQALAISKIQGLFFLPSKSTFYICCHVGTLDPLEATCGQTNNRGLRSLEEYESACGQGPGVVSLSVNIKYKQTFSFFFQKIRPGL